MCVEGQTVKAGQTMFIMAAGPWRASSGQRRARIPDMGRVLVACCTALIPLLTLSGCLIGPNYSRPNVDIPKAYRFAEVPPNEAADTAWWEQFQDPVLNELITTALQENREVKVATARIDEFVGQLITTRSGLFPQLSAGFDATRERASQSAGIPIRGVLNPIFNQFEANASGIWIIDLWGQIRRETEAARANLLATEDARRATILSLVAAVASSYINLRSLDSQLQIAQSTAASRKESVTVFTQRFQGGEVSQMELAQSESQYQEALATIPQLETQIAQQEDALSVLLGRNPEPIMRGRELAVLGVPEVPSSLTADLLDRRPDLREAEQILVSQTALVGAAKAEYFPQISLTGLFGSIASRFSDLFSGPAKVWSYAGSVVQPIFTGGRIYGDVHQAEARRLEALFAYEKAIEVAFQQVADALILIKKSREQLDVQSKQVDALATYARLARLRFEGGYTSYIEVLDAERSLFNAQLSYTQTKGTTLTALVSLYMAMGGGWVVKAEGMTMPSPSPAPAASAPSGTARSIARATP
jgi:multidrug efflux system outer membrane protein